MTKRWWVSVAVTAMLAGAGARAEVIDRVLAMVGTQVVTLSDIRAAEAFGLVPVASTLLGGLLAFRLRARLPALMALTGGVVLGVALFEVAPEAVNRLGGVPDGPRLVGIAMGGGFLAFLVLSRLLDFCGVESGRIQFSWVSASEGQKFADVIKTVTARVRELGPATRLVKQLWNVPQDVRRELAKE